ncbi:hypothetical protein [Roseitranquillus sediminis]|uniref:hypothetical protein n=1 Tax=Roseitranquillus sediminis TaxID=2809051 RepID=UPI001D0C3DBD|nr:hypothetical protein [Roseitranquillus sediminis]MBM9595690.1 hypothetical protein [Roseitranquillus sediminis]
MTDIGVIGRVLAAGPGAVVHPAQPASQARLQVQPHAETPRPVADPDAPTGPRPTFEHTFLERARAIWPDDPAATARAERNAPKEIPRTSPRIGGDVLLLRTVDMVAPPTIDLRR